MSQLAIAEVGPLCDPSLSQWLTPPALADELVALGASDMRSDIAVGRTPCVLEPSAGAGNLICALVRRWPTLHVEACEIDPRWRERLEQFVEPDLITIGDYLARPAPAHLPGGRYDLIVSNPPFDDDDETPHLAKYLDEARRIHVLLPARSLHGAERYERVWKRCDPRNPNRDWWIHRKIELITRPKFGAGGGGSDEIVLLDMRWCVPCASEVVRWL